MIDYFHPDLTPKKEGQTKKAVNELMNPQQAMQEAMRKEANMRKPKSDLMEKDGGKLLTNDGREMLNEQ